LKIGILGVGVVGSAVKYGLEKLGHNIWVHDLRLGTTIQNVLGTEMCYICVPTPSLETGQCDTAIVEKVVHELEQHGYDGIIAIKSTVEPGTTEKLRKETGNDKICFVPEFLRERCAISDFIENHDLCVIGTEDMKIFDLVKKSHGSYPKKVVQLSPTEAEFCKYFSNVYNATLITFANNFSEICEKMNVNYSNVKNAVVNRNHITDSYLDCNDSFRGFGGVCLPKDTKAMAFISSMLETEGEMFEFLIKENNKYKITVPKGMRDDS
tara:strand:+ start:74 stop:874 length:801 start_codon:yes stop_codon:yes gene_type:complete